MQEHNEVIGLKIAPAEPVMVNAKRVEPGEIAEVRGHATCRN